MTKPMKVTIVIEDSDDGETCSIKMDFDPPVEANESRSGPAASIASGFLKMIGEQMKDEFNAKTTTES